MVTDVDRAIAFYRGLLGLEVTEVVDFSADEGSPLCETAWLRCGSEHHALALFRMRDAERGSAEDTALRSTPGLHHFAFEVDSVADLVAANRELREAGVPVVATRQFGPGCHVRLYCLDPDGHRVELYWGLDTIGWDHSVRHSPPVEEIDLEAFDVEAFARIKNPS